MAVSTGYVVRETGSNLRRNLLMTVAAIITMAVSLTLVGSALLMRQAINKAAVQWKGGVELSIFLQAEVTPQQRDAIGLELKNLQEIKKFHYVDKTQAYQEFKQMFANTPELVNSLSVNDMPPSYRIVPTRPEDVQAIGDQFKNQAGVREVVYAKEIIDNIRKDFRTRERVAIVIAVGVFAGAIALIVNTIQLAIFARRREIAVMKLVGATNWFIRVPFMLEGLLEGILGAVAAFGLSYIFRDTIASLASSTPLVTGAGHGSLYVTSSEAFATGIVILIAGAFIGSAGSGFAVRRFLAV
jgi:cell division transport system permease protein